MKAITLTIGKVAIVIAAGSSESLWRQAEGVTVREIIAMIDSYAPEPPALPDGSTPAQRVQFDRGLNTYKHFMRLKGLIRQQYDHVFDVDK